MKRLLELLSKMDEHSALINDTKDKRQRDSLISKDNFTRHEVLQEVCRLYRDGTIEKAYKLLSIQCRQSFPIGVDLSALPDKTVLTPQKLSGMTPSSYFIDEFHNAE